MSWIIKYKNTKQVEKSVEKFRPSTKVAFYQAVKALAEEGPKPQGWQTKFLKGNYQGLMSLRLDYRHRLIYEVSNNILVITIIEVSTREDAY